MTRPYRVVPVCGSAGMLAAALPVVQEPSDADKRVAAAAFQIISPNSTQRVGDAIRCGADLARDYRAMISASPPEIDNAVWAVIEAARELCSLSHFAHLDPTVRLHGYIEYTGCSLEDAQAFFKLVDALSALDALEGKSDGH